MIKHSFQSGVTIALLSAQVLSGCMAQDFWLTTGQDPDAPKKELISSGPQKNDPAQGPASPVSPDHPIPSPEIISPSPIIPPSPIISPSPIVTSTTSDTFQIGDLKTKKIDMLFVIDNSGSMKTHQEALTAGISSMATVFQRADLDICLAVIKSSRYNSRSGNEFLNIGCTDSNRNTSTVLANFITSANVGTSGSGKELAGKALVTFLKNENTWSLAKSSTKRTSFFRPGAMANISFITDENNYLRCPNSYSGENCSSDTELKLPEDRPDDDIPAVQGKWVATGKNHSNSRLIAIRDSLSSLSSLFSWLLIEPVQDTRKGIQNYLDEFFSALNPEQALTYTITTVIHSSNQYYGYPSRAQNLALLPQLIGRGSMEGSIAETNYAPLYEAVTQNLIERFYTFKTKHPIYSSASVHVSIIHANAHFTPTNLSLSEDFTVSSDGSEIHLNQDSPMVKDLKMDDRLQVEYHYVP
ncbi:MAG: hypothetical protein ACO3A2_02705 [Bdellovibrionia bacterium]